MLKRKKDMMGRMMDEVELPRLTPPDDAEISGESGTAEISWKSTGDGSIEITAINGVSLSSQGNESPEPETGFEEMED